jgi:hypothetical protein
VGVEHLALVIDGTPQIHPPAADGDEDLVEKPAGACLRAQPARLVRVQRPELQSSAPDRLVRDIDPALHGSYALQAGQPHPAGDGLLPYRSRRGLHDRGPRPYCRHSPPRRKAVLHPQLDQNPVSKIAIIDPLVSSRRLRHKSPPQSPVLDTQRTVSSYGTSGTIVNWSSASTLSRPRPGELSPVDPQDSFEICFPVNFQELAAAGWHESRPRGRSGA